MPLNPENRPPTAIKRQPTGALPPIQGASKPLATPRPPPQRHGIPINPANRTLPPMGAGGLTPINPNRHPTGNLPPVMGKAIPLGKRKSKFVTKPPTRIPPIPINPNRQPTRNIPPRPINPNGRLPPVKGTAVPLHPADEKHQYSRWIYKNSYDKKLAPNKINSDYSLLFKNDVEDIIEQNYIVIEELSSICKNRLMPNIWDLNSGIHEYYLSIQTIYYDWKAIMFIASSQIAIEDGGIPDIIATAEFYHNKYPLYYKDPLWEDLCSSVIMINDYMDIATNLLNSLEFLEPAKQLELVEIANNCKYTFIHKDPTSKTGWRYVGERQGHSIREEILKSVDKWYEIFSALIFEKEGITILKEGIYIPKEIYGVEANIPKINNHPYGGQEDEENVIGDEVDRYNMSGDDDVFYEEGHPDNDENIPPRRTSRGKPITKPPPVPPPPK